MNDLISRQAAIEAIEEYFDDLPIQGYYDMLRIIENSPAVDVPERKVGKWIYTEVREYPVGYNRTECSHCHWSLRSRPGEKWILTAEEVARDFNYCPNCGAKMKRLEDETY